MMLKWLMILAVAFLAIAVFGLGVFEVGAVGMAKILYCVFLVTFVTALLVGLVDTKALERN